MRKFLFIFALFLIGQFILDSYLGLWSLFVNVLFLTLSVVLGIRKPTNYGKYYTILILPNVALFIPRITYFCMNELFYAVFWVWVTSIVTVLLAGYLIILAVLKSGKLIKKSKLFSEKFPEQPEVVAEQKPAT